MSKLFQELRKTYKTDAEFITAIADYLHTIPLTGDGTVNKADVYEAGDILLNATQTTDRSEDDSTEDDRT